MQTEKIEKIQKTARRNINMMLEKSEANNITGLLEICRLTDELLKEIPDENARVSSYRESMEDLFYHMAAKDDRFIGYLREKTGMKKREVLQKKITFRLFSAEEIVSLIRGYTDEQSRPNRAF